jgi:hypothetical protein
LIDNIHTLLLIYQSITLIYFYVFSVFHGILVFCSSDVPALVSATPPPLAQEQVKLANVTANTTTSGTSFPKGYTYTSKVSPVETPAEEEETEPATEMKTEEKEENELREEEEEMEEESVQGSAEVLPPPAATIEVEGSGQRAVGRRSALLCGGGGGGPRATGPPAPAGTHAAGDHAVRKDMSSVV